MILYHETSSSMYHPNMLGVPDACQGGSVVPRLGQGQAARFGYLLKEVWHR